MGMRMAAKNRNERHIKDQLNDWQRHAKFDIVLKCWNTMITRGHDDHCGTHTTNMHACIVSDGFRELLKECRDQAAGLWASGQNTIRVICISDQGMHRSVSVSSALQFVYLKLGFNSLGPYHMSRGHWWSDICHTCKDCKPNAYKEGMMTAWASELRGLYFSQLLG